MSSDTLYDKIEKRMKSIEDSVNSDLQMVSKVQNEYQRDAFERYLKNAEIKKIIALILKIITEINAIIATVSILVSVFTGLA